LTNVTDPKSNAPVYTFDVMDRVSVVTDPLNRVTRFGYDANGNVASATSARGKVTGYDYDTPYRVKTTRYGVSGTTAESETTYGYDPGNRVRTVTDSAGGTTTLTPNGIDLVAQVVTPQGQIDYTYYTDGRRSGMTVKGQTPVTYGYNPASQLTSITQGSAVVGWGMTTRAGVRR
jgi:YD repeat-containing protein